MVCDGVQYGTGCILGKGNIEKAGWRKLAMILIDLPDLQGVKK